MDKARGKERVGQTERVALTYVTGMRKIASLWETHRELSSLLCDDLEGRDGSGGWKGSSGERGYMYTWS